MQTRLRNDPDFALPVLLGFYAMMRTGELFNVAPQHVDGKRQGASESITVTVFDVVRTLHQVENLF